jgi:dipeptide/tripeptide permease
MAKTSGRNHNGFPMFAVILLVIGIIWLLNDLKLIAVNIPWIPMVLIIVAVGMIYNRLSKE